MKKVKFWKYSGIYLIATGILHTIFAIAFGKEAFLKIKNVRVDYQTIKK